MTYELILLDADGTLFDYDRAEKYAIETTFRDFGLDYSDAILARYRVVNDALWKELERETSRPGELQWSVFAVSLPRFARLMLRL